MELPGREWLTRCAIDPGEARATWQRDPAAPLTMATGHYFDAIIVPDRLGLETCDLIRQHRLPLGPAMLDTHARKVGFIAPPRGRLAFSTVTRAVEVSMRQLHYLSEGDFVVVPGPSPLPNSRYQWLYAPTQRADPSRLRSATLAVILCTAARNLARHDLASIFTRIPSPPPCAPIASPGPTSEDSSAATTQVQGANR